MFSCVVKILCRDLAGLFGRMERWLVSVGADRRCATRLDAVADRLLGMAGNIDALRTRLRDGDGDEPVDEDAALRRALKGVKEDIRDIRCQLASMPEPQLSGRVRRAISRVCHIAEATYASADQLQWEIAEHDARFASVN